MAKFSEKTFPFGWKHAIATIALGMCFGAFAGYDCYQQEQAIAKQKKEILARKKKLKKKAVPIAKPVHDVVYRVDTLNTQPRGLLYHTAGKIIRNFVPNSNMYRMQMMYFVHEQWHLHNHQIKYRERFPFKPEEYFRLCLHEEISANIAQLLMTRYEYLAATDKKAVVDRYKKGALGFYYDAIQKNEINPFDDSPEARKKEWTLIANGTRKMWMERFYPHYKSNAYTRFQSYLKRFGLVENSKKNYNYVLNYMYTIGGVNFAEYISEDITINDKKINLAQKLSEISSLRKYGKPFFEQVSKNVHLLDSVDIAKRQECFQHILIAEQLKLKLQSFRPEYLEKNPQVVQKYYDIVTHDAYTDPSFVKVVSEYDYFTMSAQNSDDMKKNYENVLQQIYTMDGRDLRTQIKKYDNHNVPFKQEEKFGFVTREKLLEKYMTNIFPSATVDEVRDALSLKQDTSVVAVPYSNNKSEQHLSEEMTLEVPNFWEPILISRSKSVWDKICASIQKFDEISEVEKGCDIQAQQAYRLQQKQQER